MKYEKFLQQNWGQMRFFKLKCSREKLYKQIYNLDLANFLWAITSYLLGLLQDIWETLISHVLIVLVDVEKVKAKVTLSVAWFPTST